MSLTPEVASADDAARTARSAQGAGTASADRPRGRARRRSVQDGPAVRDERTPRSARRGRERRSLAASQPRSVFSSDDLSFMMDLDLSAEVRPVHAAPVRGDGARLPSDARRERSDSRDRLALLESDAVARLEPHSRSRRAR